MDFRKKTIRSYTIRITVILLVSALIIITAFNIRPKAEEQGQFKIKFDLTLWYYDESLTPYLNTLSDAYFKKTGLRVETISVPSLEFFDNINQKNIDNDDPPDLYIIDSTKLENAYLSSLAKPNEGSEFDVNDFTAKSIEACTYKDKLVAWPFSFNTAFFAYNNELEKVPKTFTEMTREYYGDEAEAETETNAEEYDAIQEYLDAHPEETIETNTETANDPGAERIFDFDASNLLYNSFFIGKYINLGGEYGDDAKAFDLSSSEYTAALEYAADLNKKLKINSHLADYKGLERAFIEGKTKMAIFDISSLTRLYGSGLSFDIAPIPDMNDELKSRTMSQTSVICVNPGSDSAAEAEKLADYLSYDAAEGLFEGYGLMPARKMDHSNNDLDIISDIYEGSFSLPKLIETENLWENLNGMITSVWSGEPIDKCQNKLNVAVYIALSTRTEQEDK